MAFLPCLQFSGHVILVDTRDGQKSLAVSNLGVGVSSTVTPSTLPIPRRRGLLSLLTVRAVQSWEEEACDWHVVEAWPEQEVRLFAN
jgi:hypothetical protein